MRRSHSRRPAEHKGHLIVVTAERSGGNIVRLSVTGHAGFAPAGEDIVCAAVSALVQSGAHGVMRYARRKARARDVRGTYALDIPGGGDTRAQAVLETTLAGLRAIARSYPGHVRVKLAHRGTRQHR